MEVPVPNRPHKSKIIQIEEDTFKIRAVQHATQFTLSLLSVADPLQMKFSMAEAIRNMENPTFVLMKNDKAIKRMREV